MTDKEELTDEELFLLMEKEFGVTDEEFVRQVRESEEHYKRTGLHLTWDEVSEWMRKLGTPEETEMPECHT